MSPKAGVSPKRLKRQFNPRSLLRPEHCAERLDFHFRDLTRIGADGRFAVAVATIAVNEDGCDHETEAKGNDAGNEYE